MPKNTEIIHLKFWHKAFLILRAEMPATDLFFFLLKENKEFKNLLQAFLPARSCAKFQRNISKMVEDRFLVLESPPPSRKKKFTHFCVILLVF